MVSIDKTKKNYDKIIAIRVDASQQMGTGHLMRCIAIADELRNRNCYVFFICRDLLGNKINSLKKLAFPLEVLPSPNTVSSGDQSGLQYDCHHNDLKKIEHIDWLEVTLEKDYQETSNAINTHMSDIFNIKKKPPIKMIDWLIVDHYALDHEWHSAQRSVTKKIFVIDDLGDRMHDCHLLLDQNLDASISEYKKRVPNECQLLLGTRYALLRPEFSEYRQRAQDRRNACREIKDIIIFMGGIDQYNMTGDIIQHIESLHLRGLIQRVRLHVIAGSGMPNLAVVRDMIRRTALEVQLSVDTSQIANAMTQADLAIGAAGTTSWERAVLGLPSIIIIQAKNQLRIAQALERRSACLVLKGDGEALLDRLKFNINLVSNDMKLYHSMSNSAFKICDGLGTARVADLLVD